MRPAENSDTKQLNNIDIIKVVERTGTRLTKIGSLYAGLCPLHSDKDTPSFRVYPNTNSWSCFSPNCGNGHNGGDVIEFVKQRYNYSFQQAVDWLETNFLVSDMRQEIKPEKPKPVQTEITPKILYYWHSLLNIKNKREFFHSRGFTDNTIDLELFGWDGSRYIIPVWDWEPQNSKCIGVRRRKSRDDNSPKYVGFTNVNQPTVYGKWYCQSDYAICFAGELDARMAIQDGLPAFSLVNGANSFKRFPDNWSNDWFPSVKRLVVAFDKKEETEAGKLAHIWNVQKGSYCAKVFHYPLDFEGKDYCNWREENRSPEEFYSLIMRLFE